MKPEGDGLRSAFGAGEEPGAATAPQERRSRPSSATRAGKRVAAALEELRNRGFQVVRDRDMGGDGAIAHLVSGPTGVFLIETRYGRCRDEQLTETRRRAEELFRELETWVTPVICLAGRSLRGPRRKEKVWIVRRGQIVKWIAGRRNPVLESEHLPNLTDAL
jgi:hypothetical protein